MTIYQAIRDGHRGDDAAKFLVYCCMFEKPFLDEMAKLFAFSPMNCQIAFGERLRARAAVFVSQQTFNTRVRSIRQFVSFICIQPGFKGHRNTAQFEMRLKNQHSEVGRMLQMMEIYRPAFRAHREYSSAPPAMNDTGMKPPAPVREKYVFKKQRRVFKREYNKERNEVIRAMAALFDMGRNKLAKINCSDFSVMKDGSLAFSYSDKAIPESLCHEIKELLVSRATSADIQGNLFGDQNDPLFVNSSGKRLTPVAISKILERNDHGEQ